MREAEIAWLVAGGLYLVIGACMRWRSRRTKKESSMSRAKKTRFSTPSG